MTSPVPRSGLPSHGATGWTLPGQCPLCRRWTTHRLCADCETTLDDGAPPRCRTCALRLPPGAQIAQCGRCLRDPPPLDACVAALDYVFPWDRLLLKLKFHEALELAPLLAGRLDHALARADLPRELTAPDLIVPVPLSRERLGERGYNQALEIAKRLAARRQCRLCAHTLVRVRDTGPQSELPLADRRDNLRAAFSTDRPVRGQRVALVDDVMTSGATLFEAARALRRAGALSVVAWTVARTPA